MKKSASEWTNNGSILSDKKQYKKAIECFNKAIESDLNYPWAYYNRGLAYDNLKQYEKALEDYNKVIELNPDFVAETYFSRGVTYHQLKQYEKALEDYNKAIELNPNHAPAYSNRAVVYEELGQPEKAAKGVEISKTIEKQSTYTSWSEVIFGGIIAGIISGLFGFLGKGACIFVMFIFFIILISVIEPKGRGFLAAIIMAAISSTIFSFISSL